MIILPADIKFHVNSNMLHVGLVQQFVNSTLDLPKNIKRLGLVSIKALKVFIYVSKLNI